MPFSITFVLSTAMCNRNNLNFESVAKTNAAYVYGTRQVRKIQSRVMCNGQRFTQMHIQSIWPMAIQQFKNVSTSINSSWILHALIWISEKLDAIPFHSDFIFEIVQLNNEKCLKTSMSNAYNKYGMATISKRWLQLSEEFLRFDTAYFGINGTCKKICIFSSCSSQVFEIGSFFIACDEILSSKNNSWEIERTQFTLKYCAL